MFSYTEAIRYLCGDPALRQFYADDRRDEARKVIADAVWALTKEDGDGYGEMYDWIAEGDWSPSMLKNLATETVNSPGALAAEWDEMQRRARVERED